MGNAEQFRFKSTFNPKVIYEAFKVENNYLITWSFMGEKQNMIIDSEEMNNHINENHYVLI